MLMVNIYAAAAVGNSLNCVNWVSCPTDGICSLYMRYLSVMQRTIIGTLHFCILLIVSAAVAS